MEATAPIERFDEVHPVQTLDWVVHSSNAVIVYAGAHEWVHKPSMGINEVLAEAVAYLLCHRLGVPVPNGAVHFAGGQPSWLSRLVHPTKHWNYDLRASVVNLDVMASLYVLDAIIHNEDRHAGNLLLEDLGDGLYKMWSIDAADALIGDPQCLIGLDAPPNPRNHLRPTPLDPETCRAALAAAQEASRIARSALARDAAVACAIAAYPEREQDLLAALCYRCERAPAIVTQYLDLLRKR